MSWVCEEAVHTHNHILLPTPATYIDTLDTYIFFFLFIYLRQQKRQPTNMEFVKHPSFIADMRAVFLIVDQKFRSYRYLFVLYPVVCVHAIQVIEPWFGAHVPVEHLMH